MGRLSLVSAIVLVCVALAPGLIEAQLERCHTLILTPHHFLDINRFKGRWYPLKLAPSKANQVEALNYTCHSIDILNSTEENVLNFDEDALELENGVVTGPLHLHSSIVIGEVNPAQPIPAIWSVYYHVPGSNATINTQSVIVAADEDEWALEYSCGVKNGALLERMSIWSRQRTLDPTVERVLDNLAYAIGFRYENFLRVPQSQCS